MMTSAESTVCYLQRGERRIAYTVEGSGPLVVLSPGMGDVRASFRSTVEPLVEAGYRVAVADLRGHGDSDTGFEAYGDAATADDLTALVKELSGPAVIVGNSMSAGAAVLVAAGHPELVAGLVLVGPFVRNPPTSRAARIMLRVALARPWTALMWKSYLPSLYAGAKPADFAGYRSTVHAAMTRPGHAAAFRMTARTDHAPADAALTAVHAPTLVVMGAKDPDFRNPRGEAEWIGEQLAGTVLMVEDAGHYPHAQRPDLVNPALIDFLGRATARA